MGKDTKSLGNSSDGSSPVGQSSSDGGSIWSDNGLGQNNSAISDRALQNNFFAKYPAMKAIAVLAVAVFVLLGLQAFKNTGRLSGEKSNASCYGYNCQPTVSVGGRIVPTGYAIPFSYGTMSIASTNAIELTWRGANVDRCQADWTKFTGPFLPPTYFGLVPSSRKFTVTCYANNGRQVTDGLFVNVLRASSGTPTDVMKK